MFKRGQVVWFMYEALDKDDLIPTPGMIKDFGTNFKDITFGPLIKSPISDNLILFNPKDLSHTPEECMIKHLAGI